MKRSMGFYNSEIKIRFLLDDTCEKALDGSFVQDETGEYVISRKARYNKVRAVLGRLSDFERKYQKDFYELETDNDEEFLSDIHLKWISSVNVAYGKEIYAILRKYISWCRHEGIITTRQYRQHPFFETRRCGWSWKDDDWESGSISVRVSNELEYTKNNFSTEDMLNDYIFASESEFFQYVDTVYGDAPNIMIAATLCLLYYGFCNEDIRLIKRVEVNESDHMVRKTAIINNVAWQLICKAKWASGYVKNYTDRTSETRYVDGPYLIRTNIARSETEPVAIGFFRKLHQKEKSVIDKLPLSSKYKNIFVSPNDVRNLREFYRIMAEEQEYGSDYVVERFRQRQYKTSLDYRRYQVMRIKALSK